MTMQHLPAEFALSTGNFAKETGVDEKRVNSNPATLRRSIEPRNDRRLGNSNRQSPQICRALHNHASKRSAMGTKSVEKICGISLTMVRAWGWWPFRQRTHEPALASPLLILPMRRWGATLAHCSNHPQAQSAAIDKAQTLCRILVLWSP